MVNLILIKSSKDFKKMECITLCYVFADGKKGEGQGS